MSLARARVPSPPIAPSAEWARAELASLEARRLLRRLEPVESRRGAVVRVGGRELVNFSSNDYLGLASDQRLAEAARRALAEGVGAGASRLISGDRSAHHSLEGRLAEFERAEAAVLFGNGYAANLGVLSALCGEGDVIFSDELNHASIVDGCRLSRARTVVYPHCDLEALERSLRAVPGRRRLVVTDAVFSMDGDLAPLEGLVKLCREHGAALVVDEAHATGVLGPRGEGLCEELGLSAFVDVRVGTLGKALGAYGAYAASSAPVQKLLVNRARSLVFSTALPPALCAAAQRAVELVEAEPQLRARLWRNIRAFAAALNRLGIPARPRSAIFPVVLGEPERALEAGQRLAEAGLWVKPIRPPTVPEGTSRLRFAISAAHSLEHIERVAAALEKAGLRGER
ncbi:MAG: 8-amino-7-oxononanoate synthase [Myxococcales bacterium]|nr:8-amino-7-oxononanoate synthase [Myxococcales bacterium]